MKATFRKISVAVALAVGLIGLGFAAPVSAVGESPQIALSVSPTMQDVALVAGQTGNYEMTVFNDGVVPMNITMSAVPYAMNADYSENVFDAPSTRTQISQWVRFTDGDSQFRLDGGERKLVHFTVSVPLNAAAGGQYAAITALGQLEGGGSGLAASYQIASLFLSEIDGTTVRGGEVVEREFGGWYDSSDVATRLSVRNTGNTHFFVVNRLIVEGFFGGDELARVENSPSVIFGDDARDFELNWASDSPVGLYYLTQESDFLGETYSERRLALILPLWVIVLFVAVIAVLIALIIVKIKKPKSKRSGK
jgi:hypothetical protein